MSCLKEHYERIIIACAFLLLFVNVGFTSTAFSVYQSHLVDIPGVGNVGGSFVVTIRTLVALVCMFLTNQYFKLLSPRMGIFVATLCTCIAFVVFGLSHDMPGLCVAGFLAGIGYGFGGMVAATLLVGNWFRGKVGSVSGIVTMGSGFAAIVIPVCAGWVIDTVSLSASFYIEAALALLVAMLLLAFVRGKPRDIGLEPVEDAGIGKKREKPRARLSSVALPKLGYVAMIFAIVLLGGVSVAGYNYFGILLTTQGIDVVLSATLISVAGVFLTLSKLAVGIVCDRFGTLFGTCLFFALLIASMVLCALVGTGGVPEAVFAAVVLGIGMPLGTAGVSLWSLELSSPEQMVKNVKRFQIAYAFGGFAFNMMPGALCQVTGTYTTAYVVLSILAVACASIIITVYARHIARVRKARSGS